MAMILEALGHVLLINAGYALPIMLGWLDNATTEDGPDHYAEKPVTFISHKFPSLSMPFNTAVNLGYMLVAAACLLRVRGMEKHRQITHTDAYCAYVFGWFGFIYGPIQLIRILTQDHHWAIADQWVTLPIFSWVGTWGLCFLHTWSSVRMVLITLLSLCSFFLTLLTTVGFEIALGFHIVFAVGVGLLMLRKHPSRSNYRNFILAILCCCGFVVLKLLDNHLPKFHPMFTVISGHFLSKIADFMQIYYVIEFFICATREKYGKKFGKIN